MILRSDESFSRLDIFSRNHLVPSLTWDKSSDTELGSSASREHDFFKFAKCMHHKCWIHIKLLDFINVNVNEYKFMKKKHLATSFRTKKNEIHSISPLTNQCILKREMFMFFFLRSKCQDYFPKLPSFTLQKPGKFQGQKIFKTTS